MKKNLCKILCVILLVIILILVGMLTHYHFTDPGRPVWKDFWLSDTVQSDSSKTHSSKKGSDTLNAHEISPAR